MVVLCLFAARKQNARAIKRQGSVYYGTVCYSTYSFIFSKHIPGAASRAASRSEASVEYFEKERLPTRFKREAHASASKPKARPKQKKKE